MNILIGITSSVACIKIPELVAKLKNQLPNANICLISTKNVLNFININDLNELPLLEDRLNFILAKDNDQKRVISFNDDDEWLSWSKRDDPVLHIELRKWAHIYLICPLDANTLAKLSHGLCDNLVTCVARAWDFSRPIVVCPAMNTFMYENRLTKEQLDKLNELGYVEIKAVHKRLMCGDVGMGALAPIDDICNFILNFEIK